MLSSWSAVSCLSFNPSKSVHISFSSKLPTSYILNECPINSSSSHKDLGVIVSNLQWHHHHDHILGKAYKTLGIIRRTFSHLNSAATKLKLYISLIKSQLTYCSIIWRPHLIQDTSKLEQIQRRATKYIFNDYSSTYRTCLLHLNLLPLMYVFDIMSLIKSLKFPSNCFNINHFISFSSSGTRSCGVKLIHNISSTNKQQNFYFVRICRLWNALPIIDLTLPMHIIKKHLKMLFWNHFNSNFDSLNPQTFHFLCPCGSCLNSPPPVNFIHLVNNNICNLFYLVIVSY